MKVEKKKFETTRAANGDRLLFMFVLFCFTQNLTQKKILIAKTTKQRIPITAKIPTYNVSK